MRFNIVDIIGGIFAVIIVIAVLRTVDTRTGTHFVSKTPEQQYKSYQRKANKAARRASKVRSGKS